MPHVYLMWNIYIYIYIFGIKKKKRVKLRPHRRKFNQKSRSKLNP